VNKFEEVAHLLIRRDQWRRILFFVPDPRACILTAVCATEPHDDDAQLEFFLDAWRMGLAEFLQNRLTPVAGDAADGTPEP